MRSNLLDVHAYVFKRWVLDLVVEKKSLVSIREELVPLLVRRQFRQHRAQPDNPTGVMCIIYIVAYIYIYICNLYNACICIYVYA